MFDFHNKTLLLTGACGGIGRQVARLFLRHGAHLVLADRDLAQLNALVTWLDARPEQVCCVAYEAARAEDADVVVAQATARFGGIDFIVPCAGIYETQPLKGMTDAQWRQTLSINLDAIFFLCRRALPALGDGSAIVMLTSLAGHRGSFTNAHYSASKAGLLGLMRSLARELAPRTRVNAVSPGLIDTPMTQRVIGVAGREWIDQTPMKRPGQPEEIASVVGFLCSGAASFITAEVIHANGGLYAAG